MKLEEMIERAKCCICEGLLKGSHMNFIHLSKMATWEYPTWSNVLVPDAGTRAIAIACDNCVNPAKGTVKGEIKFAIEWKDGVIHYHPVNTLEDAIPITEEMIIKAER